MNALIAETSDTAQTELAYKALEHQPSAILVISSAQVLKLLNPAAEALFGVSGSRVLGKPLSALIRNTDTILEILGSSAAPGQSFTLRQQSLQVAGGRTLMVDLTCAAFDGGTDWVIQAQPLERLRRINHDDRLVNIQETTASLVRGLAHEVKNPLGGIRGAAQLLGHELQPPELAEYTEVIIRECDRLTALVDRLLGPGRPLNIAQVNVHQVLEHVARVAVENVANRQVRLKREYDPSLPFIDADEDQLIQALLNIVNNACTALDDVKGAEITLRTRPLRRFTIRGQLHRLVVSIEVEDNGPGIPDELLDRMFYPMISGRASGSGLGLAITQAIVRGHNGMVECESRPGRTFFAVILPLTQEEEGSA